MACGSGSSGNKRCTSTTSSTCGSAAREGLATVAKSAKEVGFTPLNAQFFDLKAMNMGKRGRGEKKAAYHSISVKGNDETIVKKSLQTLEQAELTSIALLKSP